MYDGDTDTLRDGPICYRRTGRGDASDCEND